ncbi:MAG: hypothetical protein ABIA78_01580 [archaeon]
MKKKGVKRSVKKSSLKSKSRFSDKQLLAITLGLFVVAFIAVNFVGVDNVITGNSVQCADSDVVDAVADCGSGGVLKRTLSSGGSSSSLGGFFGKLTSVLMGKANFGEAYIRWTFFGILSIFLFSIFSAAGWPKNPILKWLFSIPVAFLSISLINQTDLMASITSYGALALTMLAMVPLVVMFFFSAMLLQGKTNVLKIIFQLIGWYYYVAFNFYILVSFVTGEMVGKGFHPLTGSWWGELISVGGAPVMFISISGLVAIFIIIGNKKFREWVRDIGRELIREIQLDTATSAGTPHT